MRGGISATAAQVLAAIATLVLGAIVPSRAAAAGDPMIRLPGHVLPALAAAVRVAPDATSTAANAPEPMIVTLVLQRDDQSGFDRYLHDVYNPRSSQLRHFLTQAELTERFGPSRRAYDRVVQYMRDQGFTPVQDSANRLTATFRGTRAAAERAFDVGIAEYRIGTRRFHANDRDPGLPPDVASHVQTIVGLTNLASPHASVRLIPFAVAVVACSIKTALLSDIQGLFFPTTDPQLWFVKCVTESYWWYVYGGPPPTNDPPPPKWIQVDGTGETIGLVEFDTFERTDVSNFLTLIGAPANQIDNLSEVKVNGGAPSGPNADEVLLDIDDVMTGAPGAKVVVYDGPFTGAGSSFQSLFNAAINGGSTIISNSWSYCEDQTTMSDVASIDAILATAAASGITVFNATGDTGSRCLDGAANVIGVPADSPSATAVGGSSAPRGIGATYESETWWDGMNATPPSGQGGFGVSQFFPKPAYQNALNGSAMRSVPDIVVNADPTHGVVICQESGGGCPTGQLYSGTSSAAPTWATFMARLNQASGMNLGALNPLIYTRAGTSALHGPASLGSDFTHVGVGSPNFDRLFLSLSGESVGPVSPTVSEVGSFVSAPTAAFVPTGVPADGTSHDFVAVRLLDANGHSVSGKTVALAANAGSHAIIGPASGPSSVENGAVIFSITDATPENVTITATDTTDGVMLTEQAAVTFQVPVATAASVGAAPPIVAADGTSAATITVTLKDANNHGTPGKQVILSQGTGRSIVNGPNPSVTDATGVAQFTATDTFTETVTYSATDVTDGDLPVPTTAQVSFTSGSGSGCNVGAETAAAGFTVTSPVTGFALATNCAGVSGTAWDPGGNLWAMNYPTGKLYEFAPAGGIAGTGTLIGTLPDVTPPVGLPSCPHGLAFSKDGQHLYLARQFCGSGGDVVELSMTDASIVRNVTASGAIPCATGIATDPISGDLFVSTPCPPGGGTENIFRISHPESATPTVSVYSSPGHALGLNFTADGTLWTEAFPFATPTCAFAEGPPAANTRYIVRIEGTASAHPGACTYLTAALANVGGVLPASNPTSPGNPPFLLATGGAVNTGVQKVDLTQTPPVVTTVATGGANNIIINGGPDGCAYVSNGDRIDRITAADGSCNFAASSAGPTLSLSPATVTPNPLQGTTATFTAILANAGAPAGTPLFVQITGVNPQVVMIRTDADGEASFGYVGAAAGDDTLAATTTIDGALVVSNHAHVTWDAGQHVTVVTLNESPTAAMVGDTVTVIASLNDLSAAPVVPVANASIHFTLGADQCSAMTDAGGRASCDLTLTQGGMLTLSGSFAGTVALRAASGTVGFNGFVPIGAPDAFMCYGVARAKAPKGVAAFPVFTAHPGVVVVDRFSSNAPNDQHEVDLTSPAGVCNPVAGANLTFAVVGAEHLERYQAKLSKTAPAQPKPLKTNVSIENAVGPLTLTIQAVDSVAVPSGRTLGASGAPSPGAGGEATVDHFKCYKAKVAKAPHGSAPFPVFTPVQATIGDEFAGARYDLVKPTRLCAPADKNGEDPTAPTHPGHLVCYKAKLAKTTPKQPKFFKVRTSLANQFGDEVLDAKKIDEICVVSSVP
jgi:kumamolisin